MTGTQSPPEFDDRPIPLWQKAAAVVAVAAIAAAATVWHDRLHADFWPIDASRVAPNILATVIQTALALPVLALLWPPTRRRIHRFVTAHTAPLHAHFDRLHEQRERHHAELLAAHDALHEKLDAIHGHVAKPPRKRPSTPS